MCYDEINVRRGQGRVSHVEWEVPAEEKHFKIYQHISSSLVFKEGSCGWISTITISMSIVTMLLTESMLLLLPDEDWGQGELRETVGHS